MCVVANLGSLLTIGEASSSAIGVRVPRGPAISSIAGMLISGGMVNRPSCFGLFIGIAGSTSSFARNACRVHEGVSCRTVVGFLSDDGGEASAISIAVARNRDILRVTGALGGGNTLNSESRFLSLYGSRGFSDSFSFVGTRAGTSGHCCGLRNCLCPSACRFCEGRGTRSMVCGFLGGCRAGVGRGRAISKCSGGAAILGVIRRDSAGCSLSRIVAVTSVVRTRTTSGRSVCCVSSVLRGHLATSDDLNISDLNLSSAGFCPCEDLRSIPRGSEDACGDECSACSEGKLPCNPVYGPNVSTVVTTLGPGDSSCCFFYRSDGKRTCCTSALRRRGTGLRCVRDCSGWF